MIFDSDAVVNPWAVVVESLNALVADGTVSASGRSDDFALWAEVSWVDISEQLEEGLTLEWFQNTCVFAACEQESQEHTNG